MKMMLAQPEDRKPPSLRPCLKTPTGRVLRRHQPAPSWRTWGGCGCAVTVHSDRPKKFSVISYLELLFNVSFYLNPRWKKLPSLRCKEQDKSKKRAAYMSQYLLDLWQKAELILLSVWVHCHYLKILVWIVDKTLLRVQCIPIPSSLLPFPPRRGTVAHKIMQKYGFKEGQGLGKHEQGLSTALSVEKTSKRGGKIIIGDAAEKRERRRVRSCRT